MNICFLTETPSWGGAEVHTVRLAEVLAGRGHAVRIIALGHRVYDEAGRRPGARFTVQHVPLAGPVKGMSRAACDVLVRGLPDGVGVLVRFGMDVGSLRLDLAARRRFRRYLAVEHSAAVLPACPSRRILGGLLPGLGLWRRQARLLWYLRSLVPHKVVCVSQAARRRLIHDFGAPARKVVTIHNGIDAEAYRPDAGRRAAARRAWGVPDGALVFGSVSRLHPEKGFDLAVEGLARLAARRPDLDARLVLVGDGPARESLARAAREAGLQDRVVLPGFTERPWEAYPGLDLFLLPSQDESLSLSLIEAMASGCCPVAMNVGGVPEILTDAAAGWLVPAADRGRFIEAMGEAAALDPGRRAAMGRAARESVVGRFDAGRQYAALADLIENGEGGVRSAEGVAAPPRSLEPCV